MISLLALAVLAPQSVASDARGFDASTPVDLPSASVLTSSGDPHVDEVAPGDFWVRGETYKAHLDAEGFTYIPFLGADAPRNFPLDLSLASVTTGAGPLELVRAVTALREGLHFALDRGPVEVRYDVGAGGVEQSFLLPEGVTGAVTLTLSATTAMELTSSEAPLVWENDHGAVGYGEAVAFDGAGRRVRVPCRAERGRIELTVPAEFTARASGRILVDPLITTRTFDVPPAELLFPDVAYGAGQDEYLIAYQARFSGSDIDVFTRVVEGIDADDVVSGWYDLTSADVREPSVAHLNSANRYCIVAQRDVGGLSSIVSRVMDDDMSGMTSTTYSPAQLVLTATSVNRQFKKPDLGGNVSTTHDRFCLVVIEEALGAINGAFMALDPNGAAISSTYTFLESSSASNTLDVAISKTIGDPSVHGSWPVTWIEKAGAGAPSIVRAARIWFFVALADGPFEVASHPSGAVLAQLGIGDPVGVRDASGDPYFLVHWSDIVSNVNEGLIALCAGNIRHGTHLINRLEHVDEDTDITSMAAIPQADGWMIVHKETTNRGVTSHDVILTTLKPVGDTLGVTERRTQVSTRDARQFQAASTYPHTALFRDGLVVWHQTPGTSTFDIGGAVVAIDQDDAAGGQYCYSTPNTSGVRGFLYAAGSNDVLDPKQLVVVDLPANVFGFFVNGRVPAQLPGAGGSEGTLCLGNPINRMVDDIVFSGPMGTFSRNLDPTAILTNSGPEAAVAGQSWYFQAWHRDTVGGVNTSNFTNGVIIRFR